MRREPSLTFQGALKILGHDERGWLKKLDNVLGGVILAAGVGAGVAAVGPPVLASAGMFAAVWGWVEQKGVAVDLLGQAIAKVSGKLAGTKGYERRQLIAAAHTTIVVAAFFEAFKEHIGPQAFGKLELSDSEKEQLVARRLRVEALALDKLAISDAVKEQLVARRFRVEGESIYDFLYSAEVPAPSAALGFEENVAQVRLWNHGFATRLLRFLNGIAAAEKLRIDWNVVIDLATERYRSHFLALATTVPDFMIWASLSEHAATRTAIAGMQADIARTGAAVRSALDEAAKLRAAATEMRADFAAALNAQRDSLGRVEALLALDTPTTGALRDLCAAVQRANGGILDEPIVATDSTSYGPHITFPAVGDIYIDPRYRAALVGGAARPADDNWWEEQTPRDDFDLMLAGYVKSPDATRLPMLLLGHPGAGKSLLTKVLAARLPASAYTVVRVPLRRVGSNAPLIDQIQEALDLATNRRVEWWQLADQSAGTVCVVLLDGLDELLQASQQDRTGYLQEVVEFQRREAEQQQPVVVIVTSRTVVADRVSIPDGAAIVKLDPFSDDDIADWVGQWNRANAAAINAGTVRELTLKAARSQPELAQQPLLLMMLALYAADPELPSLEEGLSTADLYGRLLDRFARREAEKELPQGTYNEELEQRIREHLDRLAIAALAMFNRGRQDIGEEELGTDLAALDERLMTRTRPVEAGQRIIGEFFFVHAPEARTLTGSTEPQGSQTAPPNRREPPRRAYEFLHATFGEYLVARRVMDQLIEVADKTYASRRGPSAPDDDLLYALLCHQPLAVRQSTLSFMTEIFAGLTQKDREQLLDVLEVLLSGYRNRSGSNRYTAYRPKAPDLVRQMACYSANLVAMRVTLEPDSGGVPLSRLLRASTDSLEQWRSTVLLWKTGLDADGLQSMLATVKLTGDQPCIIRTPQEDVLTGRLARDASEIALNRFINDRDMELRLRFGYAIRNNYLYDDNRSWMAMMASWLVPAIAGLSQVAIIREPPEGTPDPDIAEVARLIFIYLKSPGLGIPGLIAELIKLIFSMPPVFYMDGLALATAVLEDPGLPSEIPRLTDDRIYGGYATLVRRRWPHDEPRANFDKLPNDAIAAIQEILLYESPNKA